MRDKCLKPDVLSLFVLNKVSEATRLGRAPPVGRFATVDVVMTTMSSGPPWLWIHGAFRQMTNHAQVLAGGGAGPPLESKHPVPDPPGHRTAERFVSDNMGQRTKGQ